MVRALTQKERTTALQDECAALEKQLLAAQQDVIDGENQLAPYLRAIADLEAKHANCCRLEAAGQMQVGERAEIEIDLLAARKDYKVKSGLVSLPEKRATVARIRATLDPLSIELREANRQAYVQQESQMIEALYQEGLTEIQSRNELAKSFFERIKRLRQYGDPHLNVLASNKALLLERVWNGMSPE